MDTITVDPCNVCGGKDVNLIDGYYYCVECGTQDVNVRQTLIEDKALADGTYTFRQKKKITVILEEKTHMSAEWHKWHAFNFILAGLADELIALGANPSFKMKVLWLWTEYIKKFQDKEELGLPKGDDTQNTTANLTEETTGSAKKKKKNKTSKWFKDIGTIKKSLIVSFLYLGLNLDRSDIQLSDLFRFIKEGRLSILDCTKYVPKEIDVNLIPDWKRFTRSLFHFKDFSLYPIPLLKCLDIAPIMPNLTKIVDKFIKELCMPKAFRELVLSLMELCPPNYLELDRYSIRSMVRLPLYEMSVMSFILVAFKMCFGLDDDYEVRLSDAVEKINDENCYLKSYKLGELGESEPSDRLFSFKEWCNFIQLRKIILSKYYLYMSEQFSLDVDDYVFMEQFHGLGKKSRKPILSEEITMDMLEKIPLQSTVQVIPKKEFKPTLTPLSTYTDLVLQYYDDPDLRLLFSEDFTQYSLAYACEKLELNDGNASNNIITGVSDSNKTFNSEIYGTLKAKNLDLEMVYIRNCDNKNWLKTNQPTKDHIMKINENSSDKESDHGYDSNTETVNSEIEISSKYTSTILESTEVDKKLELIEEDKDPNIFDDEFADLNEVEEIEDILVVEVKEENNFEEPADPMSFVDTHIEDHEEARSPVSEETEMSFNPQTFDRERTIKELILAACKKYKIKVPSEYDTKEPKKRKLNLVKDQSGESRPKRRRESDPNRTKRKRGEAKEEINKLVAAYYENLQHDVFHQLSEQVKTVVNNVHQTHERENIGDTNTPENLQNNDDLDDHHSAMVEIDRNLEPLEIDEINDENKTESSASVQCLDESDAKDLQEKWDPRFDEEEYDVKQLYVKAIVDDDSDPFDIADDPEVAAILDKKIEEAGKTKVLPAKKTLTSEDKDSDEDSDEDLPLSVIKDAFMKARAKENYKLQPLLRNLEVSDFKYWIRKYAALTLCRSNDMHEPFKRELLQNFPRSFVFVLRECASILHITPYQLYRSMINLEQIILSRC